MRMGGHITLKTARWSIAAVSAVIGGFFGAIGAFTPRPPLYFIGTVVLGGGTGFLSGWFFLPLLLSVKTGRSFVRALARVLAGTAYGCVAGLISGVAVHLPKLAFDDGNSGEYHLLGAFVGIIVGTLFGSALSLAISVAAEIAEARARKRPGETPCGG